MLDYVIYDGHPLNPERLRRTIELLGRYGVEPIDPGMATREDALRVHSEAFVDAVYALDPANSDLFDQPYDHENIERDIRIRFGFASGDNPPFRGMYESSLAYLGGTVRAALAVRDGAPLSFGIAGGLHHARRSQASGFCIFDDPAVACHILREKFDRVAYVDIDVHHGDGVQWIFYNDPTVLTCSIHEEPRSLYPGTGGVEEVGEQFTSLNVPLKAGTTGDVWLNAFEQGILPGLVAYQPQAIVLQMGTDSHAKDPLAHIQNTQSEWLAAVQHIMELGLPIVAVGGGGYSLDTVPRMWTSACLTLGGVSFEDAIPADLAQRWAVPTFSDEDQSPDRGGGKRHADSVVDWLKTNHHPNIPSR